MKHDIDTNETGEWLDAFGDVVRHSGKERAAYLLGQLTEQATEQGFATPNTLTTPYVNTIAPENEARMPGDVAMEGKIDAIIRWNALMMVMRANSNSDSLGGHISSFSSSATLYDVGFNHFFRGDVGTKGADLVFYQGHISPGIYARSFVEGRLSQDLLDNFRREVDGEGLSSYPHPWLMPDYWQFPTVSMGLGPIQAIYQAHVMKYQNLRGVVDQGDRQVWAFLGDGECDEPESLGAIGLAGREKLSNLNFVINCNLQRLDGPVRGNSKIMQELEGIFRGAGWNVIKVVWGHQWDDLLAKDTSGLLKQRMNEVCDGEMQNYKANGGAYTREHFFGKYPETLELVKHLSDDEVGMLARGGHDSQKVYAAYDAAVKCTDQPTVILAQTVKGYGFGDQGQAQNETHQLKKLDQDNLKRFRDLFNIPVKDEDLADLPYYRPAEDSPELAYMRARRDALGGPIPSRRDDFDALEIPALDKFKAQLKSTGEREISTTMAFVRQLSTLAKDKKIGERIVPIVPDEARTFGMEGMFRQLGIYSPVGQRYTPHDSDQMMFYKESDKGQILEEGINEAGATASWLAAATSYSAHNYAMIPFYIYYSMFGFQRVMDLIWAAGDSQARGFLLGATAGRTTLNGEGLQHQDGHSHLMANMVPNCVSYDPTYSYEVAVIVQDGINKMYGEEKKNVFYYLTLMNENYQHPEKPEGCEEGIIAGMYKLRAADPKAKLRVQLMGSGTILREVEAAVELLANYGVDADVWSVTSANELTREAQDCDRWNLMHPTEDARVPYITEKLNAEGTPVIASTDYMRAYMHQLSPYVNQPYRVLGTDGYGRSDSRRKLREFFEVDRNYVTLAALKSLADAGSIKATVVAKAIEDLGINPEKLNPLYC